MPLAAPGLVTQEYKNAASFLLNRTPSGAEREVLVATLASLSGQVVRGIAQGRGLTEKQARSKGG